MKQVIYILLVSIASVLSFSACDREKMDFGNNADGYGKLNLSSLKLTVDVKVTPVSRAATVDASNYIVSLYSENGETLISEWKYSEMPEIFQLKVGKYKAIAHAPNGDKAAFDDPYCEGTKNFEIQKDQVTNIETINCTLSCVAVAIKYEDAFKNLLGEEVDITVKVSNYSLKYDKNETRIGYFPAVATGNLVHVKLIGEIDGDKDVPIDKKFPSVNIGSLVNATFKLQDANGNPGSGGSLSPSLKYDITCTIEEINGTVHPGKEDGIEDFPSGGGGEEDIDPTVTSGNPKLDLNEPIDANTYDEETDGLVLVNLLAPRGIQNIFVDISTTDEEFLKAVTGLFGGASFDLANPPANEDYRNNLIDLGFSIGDEVKTTNTVPFDITTFVPLLQAYHGTHQFKITVKDVTNVSATATLTLTTK